MYQYPQLKYIALSLAISASFNVYAASSTPGNSPELDPVVVVASQTPKAITDIPATVWYIDRLDVDQAARVGKSLSNLLSESIPSLDLGSERRTNFGQQLRGREVQIMIDGVSLNSSRKISRQLDSISLENIESIEVLSGASAVYGGGATGGIINIKTKESTQGKMSGTTSAAITTGFEKDDLAYKGHLGVTGGNERLSGNIGLTYEKTGLQYDGHQRLITPDITQGSLQDNQMIDLLASTRFTIDAQQTLDLSAQYYDSKQDMQKGLKFNLYDALILKKGPLKFSIADGFSSDRQAQTKRQHYNLNYAHQQLLGHRVQAQLAFRKERLDFIPFINIRQGFFSASEQSTNVLSAHFVLHKQWDRLSLSYGLNSYRDSLDSNQMIFNRSDSIKSGGLINRKFAVIGRYPKTTVTSVAAFAQSDFDIDDKLSVSGGVRFEHLRNDIGDFIQRNYQAEIALGNAKGADKIPGGKNTYNVSLFNIGVNYKHSDTQRFWANFSQGFELPDPAKYYGVGRYKKENNYYKLQRSLSANDTKLKGIKTNSYELGSSYRQGPLRSQLSAYYSLSDGSIQFVPKTSTISQSKDKTKVYGIEGKAAYAINNNLEIGAMLHWLKSQTQINGHYQASSVMRASPSKYGLWLAWRDEHQEIKLQAQHLTDIDGKQLIKNKIVSNSLEGYTRVDFNYAWLFKNGELSFGIENLLDANYTTIWSQQAQLLYGTYAPKAVFDYKGTGRTYTLGYTHHF